LHQSTQRLAAWIACIAILLAALAPSVSRVLAAAPSSNMSWIEICSATGSKFVKVLDDRAAGKVSKASEKSLHANDCPYCLTQAASFALPPNSAFVVPVMVSNTLQPSLFFQAPRPLFIWASAQSRAPPTSA